MLILIGLIYAVVYFSAMVDLNILLATTYSKVRFERGTIRIAIPGILYAVIGLFLSFDKIYKEKKYYHLLLVIIFLMAIILKGTRAVIIPVGILTLFYLLRNMKKGSILSFSIIFLGVIITAFFFINILQSVYSLLISTTNMQEGNTLIRLKAVTYFFYYLFPNEITYILGNGFSSQLANYGQEVLYFKLQQGIYQSDIGIIGDYTQFGIVYLLGVFLITYEFFKHKIKIKEPYILYSFYFIIISMITLSHFGTLTDIPAICILLFLYDKDLRRSFSQNLRNP